MSYPRQAKLFKKWSEAMLQGATVDKPSYSTNRSGKSFRHKRKWRKKRKGAKALKGD